MKPLETIGMQKGWIYEVIVSTYRGRKPHSAPIGIWTDDFTTLTMEIFPGSRTLESIMELREFAVNLSPDITVFYDSLFDAEKMEYREAVNVNAPVIRNCEAFLEARLENVEEKENKFRLESVPVNIEVNGPVKLINRAEAIAIESLILATRLPYLPASNARAALMENYRIAGKAAPGSRYEKIVEKLLESLGLPASNGGMNAGQ